MTFSKSLLALPLLAFASIVSCGKSGDVVRLSEVSSEPLLTELDPLALSEGKSTFEGIVPLVHGKSDELRVGRMNGIVLRSLLRFRMPADSMARAAGGNSARDLVMISLRMHLRTHADGGGRGIPDLQISRPEGVWDETSTFVSRRDPAAHVDLPASALPGATVTDDGAGRLTVDLPGLILDDALDADAAAPFLEVMLHPAAGSEFLTVLTSGDASRPGTEGRRPKLEFLFTLGGEAHRFETGAVDDTYWGARTDDRPETDQLMVASGIRYGSLLRFDVPNLTRRTVYSAELEVEVDPDLSFFDVFPFQIDRVDASAESGRLRYTTYDSSRFTSVDQTGTVDLPLDRALVNGWTTGAIPNRGVALRPRDDAQLAWVVIRNSSLKVVYVLQRASRVVHTPTGFGADDDDTFEPVYRGPSEAGRAGTW